MRYALIAALAFCAVAAQAIPQAVAKRKIPCKTRENAASCYWTHGRLGVYNGNPSLRVWRIGTTKIVGIHSGPGAQRRDPEDGEHPEFPPNIERLMDGWNGQWSPHLRGLRDLPICAGGPRRNAIRLHRIREECRCGEVGPRHC